MVNGKNSFISATAYLTNRLDAVSKQKTFMLYPLSALPVRMQRTDKDTIPPKSLMRFIAKEFSTF